MFNKLLMHPVFTIIFYNTVKDTVVIVAAIFS